MKQMTTHGHSCLLVHKKIKFNLRSVLLRKGVKNGRLLHDRKRILREAAGQPVNRLPDD